jgi:ribonuclease T2
MSRPFLTCLLSAALSLPLLPAPAQAWWFHSDREALACDDVGVLARISAKFRYQAVHVHHDNSLGISSYDNVHQHRYLDKREDRPIARRYCGAEVTLSDGGERTIWFMVERGVGFASVGDNVEFCVSGFDRWNVYNIVTVAALALMYRSGAHLPAPQKTVENTGVETVSPASPQLSSGNFDFYVLALSWSPSYCKSKGGGADPRQCGASKPYGFIVHGLWPQFEHGAPENCAGAGTQPVDRVILQSLREVMPSASLARHEWSKHGTCSGLSQQTYFNALLAAKSRIFIPNVFSQINFGRSVSPTEVERAFLGANSGMKADGFAAACDGQYLTEVRICLTKNLLFRACDEVDRHSCRAGSVEMPPAR